MYKGKSTKIMSIEGLRGVLFCLIFLFHLSWFPSIRDSSYYSLFSGFGITAVSYFFVISGYVNYLSLVNKKIRTYNFVFKRVSKFYIYYIIAIIFEIILSVYLDHKTINYNIVLSHLFLVQSLVPNAEYYLGLNGVTWFLSTLTICYFFMIPIAKYLDKLKQKKIMIMSTLFIQLFFAILFVNCDRETTRFLLYINPFSRIFEIILGMLLASMHKENLDFIKGNKYIPIIYFAIILFSNKLFPYSFTISLLPGFGCLILLDKIIRYKNYVLNGLLSNSIIKSVGKNSMFLYIIHQEIFKYVLYLNWKLRLDFNSLQLIVSSITLIMGCLLLKRIVESHKPQVKEI